MKYSFLSLIFVVFFFSGCSLLSKFNFDLNKATEKTIEDAKKKSAQNKEPAKAADNVKKMEYNADERKSASRLEPVIYSNLNNAIFGLADQLFKSNINKNETRIILTTFVDLNNLEETNTFGRIVSESMFNELHIRGFRLSDFRGQDAVSVTTDGEFHITRDVDRLKDHVSSTEFILVGTFAHFEDQSLLVNGRIMDSITGDIVSTARVVFKPKNCKVFDVCEPHMINKEIISEEKKVEVKLTPFPIVKDKK